MIAELTGTSADNENARDEGAAQPEVFRGAVLLAVAP